MHDGLYQNICCVVSFPTMSKMLLPRLQVIIRKAMPCNYVVLQTPKVKSKD